MAEHEVKSAKGLVFVLSGDLRTHLDLTRSEAENDSLGRRQGRARGVEAD